MPSIQGNQNYTYKFLSDKIFDQVRVNPEIPIKYSMLRDYVVELQSTNPNTIVKITIERNTDPSLPTRVFQRIYLCLVALKLGFRARELLGLDGAFTKGPFPGQVLETIRLDSNNGIYPLDYALVEAKNRRRHEASRSFGGTQRPGHFAKDCRASFKRATPVNAVIIEFELGTCYECGSREHFRNTFPKLNRAPGQVGNRLTIEGNQNTRDNGKRATGRAFNVNVNEVEALQDPKVMTGTFSLNDHFATVLFDSRADFIFISTEFAPLLNVKPSIVNHGYVIEVADDKKIEVDRIIRDCKLELENSLFSINLIPLGQGSFDVIVGMDWLSQNKVVIVCHEKVAEIPFKGSGILWVQRERTLGAVKALMNAKVDEPKLSDISIVRDFVDVFLKDLSGLPPQRQVKFRIDLVPGATPVAKSPYRLAPSEMQELYGQL
ncbi:putative reverse transcriptase domain-containing protein [Tanacetum coccineum]|uniref:Reverse transcriptase domain-containing protein n=1 Tax=Tanacetum coccineum TaxID=301880 RepID=A0ABQ5DYT7_9ASTR